MAKKLREIVKGVKASKVVPNTLGGYKPKAGDEQKFVEKHKIQKWADRAGNGDDVYNATNVKHSQEDEPHGYKDPEDKKVNEEKSCNMTEAGDYCPIHEYAECKKEKMLKEKGVKEETEELEEVWIVKHSDGKTTQHPTQKLAMKHAREVGGKVSATHGAKGMKASVALAKTMKQSNMKRPWETKEEVEVEEAYGKRVDAYAHERDDNSSKIQDWSMAKLDKHRKIPHGSYSNADIEDEHKRRMRTSEYQMRTVKEEAEQVDEVLSKKAPAGEWIKDFQKSDNPKFAGKSMEKRKQMALAAYYAKQRNEEVEESLVMPLLGSTNLKKKKKGTKEQTGPDTPLTFPNMSVDVNTGHNV
jgi:hypothetical protein